MSFEGDFIGFFEGSVTEPFENLGMRTVDDAFLEATGMNDYEKAVGELLNLW